MNTVKIQRANLLRDSLEDSDPEKSPPSKATVENGEGEVLEVIYDPVLKCYYDPKSNSYYEIA